MGTSIIEHKKLIINGKPRILLCSSLFYFRIPKELWEDRIIKIKNMGYNTVDVYFPWNYHEREEENWKFSGDRDINVFLRLLQKHDMYVIARPGPYICSEWDMGGLPPYLLTKDIKIRQNDKTYLQYVKKWYDHILPILYKYQISTNGTIVALQIENELDFYNCDDVSGYMKELRKMVKQFNFDIPIIACAGQGDLCGATEYIEDVVPALNVYLGKYDRKFACVINHVKQLCNKLNSPLLVTETDRDITMLRMLFGVGAALIAPYNQVGGSNYYYYNGLTNWGKPNAFMTSDYDFDSLVKPDGEYGIGEGEAIVFKGIYKTFESIIAEGNVSLFTKSAGREVHYVADKNGTKLHTFLNPEPKDIVISINDRELRLMPYHVHYVVENFSLAPYVDAEILFSTAEITNIEKIEEKIVIDVFTRTNSFIALKIKSQNKIVINCDESVFDEVKLSFSDKKETISLVYDGKEILIRNYTFSDIKKEKKEAFSTIENIEIGEITELKKTVVSKKKVLSEDSFLEYYDIFYGVGEYHFSLSSEESKLTKMLLLENPGDVVTVYQEDEYLTTIANGGFSAFVPVKDGAKKQFIIRAEIWGHSNFNDNITPNTLLASKRGVKKVAAVSDYEDISEAWLLTDLDGKKKNDLLQRLGNQLYVSDSFKATYVKTIQLKKGNAVYLYFKESEANYYVHVNKNFIGKVSNSGFLNISDFSMLDSIELEILVEKAHHSCEAGDLFLIQGKLIEDYDVKKIEVEKEQKAKLKQASLPNIILSQGSEYLVNINMKDIKLEKGMDLQIKGKNILVKAIGNEKVYSRIFLSDDKDQSKVLGGNPNQMFLPNEIIENGLITLYIYAINDESNLKSIDYKILK